VAQADGQVAAVAHNLVDLVPKQQQAFHGYFLRGKVTSVSKESFIRSDQLL
jgi:hypothetical protein